MSASKRVPTAEGTASKQGAKEKSKKLVEILMQQNSQLEREIQRLHAEIDEVTKGVLKRGYLHKFREREISYASKWGLRYFVLQGKTLSYYIDDRDLRPRRTIELAGCIVRDEGTKKGGYNVFSLYWPTSDDNPDVVGSLLIRLSSENKADAAQWISMLESASKSEPEQQFAHVPKFELPSSKRREKAGKAEEKAHHPHDNDDWQNTAIIDEVSAGDDPVSEETLRRVRSSNLVLQQSQSRQLLSPKADRPSLDENIKISKSGNSLLSDTMGASAGAGAGALSKSVAKPADKKRRFPASKPMHFECRHSPLSAEVRPSEQNYRGFFNLGVIILVLSNFRMIIDNLLKYGLLINFPQPSVPDFNSLHLELATLSTVPAPIVCLCSWALSVVLVYLVENLAARNVISEAGAVTGGVILGVSNIILPCMWTYYGSAHPGLRMIYLLQSVVLWMKLISYSHVNSDLRKLIRSQKLPSSASAADFYQIASLQRVSSGLSPLPSSLDMAAVSVSLHSPSKADGLQGRDAVALSKALFQEVKDLLPPFIQYPFNITLSNLVWFCFAPTLCYQLNYPRTPKVRIQYVINVVVRILLCAGLILFSVEQYIVPTLAQAFKALESRDALQIVLRLLKLSIPNTYVWLLGFYLYFHLWLNLMAELTRFGDRMFYKDWWNSRTIDTYWRTWNLPVHNWMLRHLYYPLLGFGCTKTVATLLVFLFSAVFHEVIISTPFKHFALHAFAGMLAQAPLISITKFVDKLFNNAFIGNVIFWCAFCVLGQPMGVILYYYDLSKINAGTGSCSGSSC